FTSPLHVDAATSSPAAQSPVPQPPPVAAVIPEVPVAKPRDSPTSPRLHCLLHHLEPRCSGTSTTKQNPSIRLLLGRNAATKTSHGFLLHLRLLGCFSWGDIHDNERTIPPEFFDGKSASEHLDVYKYYRDWIVRHSGEIRRRRSRSPTTGGLIDYTLSAKPSAKEEREREEGSEKGTPCWDYSSCKSPCSMACFTTDKLHKISNLFYRMDSFPSSQLFKKVDITEERKSDRIDKEPLSLVEVILQYVADWKKVAVYVGTMSEIDYAARFIKLAFAEQFLGPEEAGENGKLHMKEDKVITMPGGENVKEQDFPK
ncbi:hypothetical protein B296_00036352, partial [Ensete ventricosum]